MFMTFICFSLWFDYY